MISPRLRWAVSEPSVSRLREGSRLALQPVAFANRLAFIISSLTRGRVCGRSSSPIHHVVVCGETVRSANSNEKYCCFDMWLDLKLSVSVQLRFEHVMFESD
jgi:hypothetical protein